jgi:hypothetical protein
MKAKRQAIPSKPSTSSIILMIGFGGMAILCLFLGAMYQVPDRFTLPLAIVFFWISGAIALWHFGKRRF